MMRRLFQILKVVIGLLLDKIRTCCVKITTKECGKNLHVMGSYNIINSKNLSIGSDCCINHGVYINAHNYVKIGDDVTLSANSRVISTGINIQKWMNGSNTHNDNGNIIIGDHVWIGADATILEGVTISGPYVVVAAGAIVTKSIDTPYCLVAGIPARVVKNYDVDNDKK